MSEQILDDFTGEYFAFFFFAIPSKLVSTSYYYVFFSCLWDGDVSVDDIKFKHQLLPQGK